MKKLGALDDAMENLGPFALKKVTGKHWEAKWPDEQNGKLGPWWCNGTLIWGPFDDKMGKLETLCDDEIEAPSSSHGEIEGPRPRILFKRLNMAP